MPGSLKRALVREVARRGSNLNDVAVALLAERFGIPFSPSGRRRKVVPSAAGAVVLRMPADLRRELKASAQRRKQNVNDLVRLAFTAVGARSLGLSPARGRQMRPTVEVRVLAGRLAPEPLSRGHPPP